MLEVRFRLVHPPLDAAKYDDQIGAVLGAVYSEFDGVGYVTAYGEQVEGDAVAESVELARRIAQVGRVPVRECDSDLVDITEIARRCDVTHEAARNWAAGARRVSALFPSPSHVIAGRKLWDWSDVNAWLKDVLPGKADATRLLSRSERVRVNYHLLCRPESGVAAGWLRSRQTSSFPTCGRTEQFCSIVSSPRSGPGVTRTIALPRIRSRS